MYTLTSGIVLLLCFLSTTVSSLPVRFSLFKNVEFQNIVVFGDSLSDNGNVFALTNQTYPIPPYYNGRYSDGPNWVDQLGVSGVSDYAYGSATTDNNLVQGYTKGNTIPVPGILQQIEIYLNNTDVTNIDFERTLYIIFGGGNDFIFDQTLEPSIIAASLFKSPQALLDIGAKYILIFNQAPVQYFPFSKPFNSPELFTYLTDQGNFYISNLTESMQLDNPQALLTIFDIYTLVLNIVTQNSTMFTNTVDNCWTNFNVTTVIQNCSNPEDYFFIDSIHFTSRAHKLIADAIRPILIQSNETSTSSAITTTQTTTSSVVTTTQTSTSSAVTTTQTSTTSAVTTTQTTTTSAVTTTQTSTSSAVTTIQTTISSSVTNTQTSTSSAVPTIQTSTSSAVTIIPQLNSNDTLIVFFLLQFLYFFQ
jgi:phospholipase/lecithinase/hemolysin